VCVGHAAKVAMCFLKIEEEAGGCIFLLVVAVMHEFILIPVLLCVCNYGRDCVHDSFNSLGSLPSKCPGAAERHSIWVVSMSGRIALVSVCIVKLAKLRPLCEECIFLTW
jgi:hypothetical protein